MQCSFCYNTESQSGDAKALVCSWCTQILLAQPQEKLKRAYQLALDKDMPNKAKAIEMFMQEEENVPETRLSRQRMDGGKALRVVKAASKFKNRHV